MFGWNFTIGYRYSGIRICSWIFSLRFHWSIIRPIGWWDSKIDQSYWRSLKLISRMREPSKLINWLRHPRKFSLPKSNTLIHGSLRLNFSSSSLTEVCEVKIFQERFGWYSVCTLSILEKTNSVYTLDMFT
jgi:hypothetical protein